MANKSVEISVWEKYALTVKEAAAYFQIVENKLRRILDDNPRADYVIWNGIRSLIKREKFEEYLDHLNSI